MKMPASFAEFSDALQKARIKDGMKKFHVTRKTVLTIVGVTLPLTAAAILLPRLKRSRRARSVRA